MIKRKTVAKVSILVLLLSVIVAGNALAGWQGSTHPRINSSASVYPNKVISANDPGCNDYFAVYYNVSTLPTKTYADNLASRAHIQNESSILISQAIRTVGYGAVWFSKCFIAGFLQHSSKKALNSNQVYDLPPRELEVIRFVAEGLSNRQIARSLSVKERTIEFHMTSILQKLNLDNRVSAAMWTRDHIL